jgi:carbon starvation protein CstA
MGEYLGGIIIVSVMILAVTTGDTALRSTRLILAEFLHIDQKKLKNRVFVSLVIFALTFLLMLYGLFSNNGFSLL